MTYEIPGEGNTVYPSPLVEAVSLETDLPSDHPAVAYLLHLLMQRDKLNEEVEKGMIDVTTGLLNKNAIFTHIEDKIEMIEAPQREADRHKRLLLMVVDVEKFKYINDTFGWSAGDKVLNAVGGFMKTLVRHQNGDRVARPGGDEFFVVVAYDLRDSTDEQVLDSLESRIRNVVFEKYPGLIPLRWNHAFYEAGDTRESLIEKADVKASEKDPLINERVRYHAHSEQEYEAALQKAKTVSLSK